MLELFRDTRRGASERRNPKHAGDDAGVTTKHADARSAKSIRSTSNAPLPGVRRWRNPSPKQRMLPALISSLLYLLSILRPEAITVSLTF
jgi:hypothetical protein